MSTWLKYRFFYVPIKLKIITRKTRAIMHLSRASASTTHVLYVRTHSRSVAAMRATRSSARHFIHIYCMGMNVFNRLLFLGFHVWSICFARFKLTLDCSSEMRKIAPWSTRILQNRNRLKTIVCIRYANFASILRLQETWIGNIYHLYLYKQNTFWHTN